MAGLNVAEWTPDQVAEWLSGLGPSVAQYVPSLQARGLDGRKLLILRCDDLEYLGVHIIGHQELMLEAVEHLRNFQYEVSRECIQQLALRVCVCAECVVRGVRGEPRLSTQHLADVARAVSAVRPLACWLEPRAPRRSLLTAALEAATCAMRDTWSEQPARAVRAAAATAAAAAANILREARDPRVLQPASLVSVVLRPRRQELGFSVRVSPAGHLQLAGVRFGSPAHASGAVLPGDEIVAVAGACVLGWSAREVEAACLAAAARGELALRLRRRVTPPAPLARRPRRELLPPAPAPVPEPAGDASDDSEPLSPPASPTLHTHHSRMYGCKPAAAVWRRHSVSGGSPASRRHMHALDPFWQHLKERRGAGGSAGGSPEPDDVTLYARDKAVSYSTGLELPPRPRTCGGPPRCAPPPAPPPDERCRGKLDKAYSTPAYEPEPTEPVPLAPLPEPADPPTPDSSPTVVVHSAAKADQILAFKKYSSVIGEAMQQRRHHDTDSVQGTGPRDESTTEKILETINIAMMEHRRKSLLEGTKQDSTRHESKRDNTSDSTEERPTPRYSQQLSAPNARGSPPPAPPRPPALGRPHPPSGDTLPVLRAVPRTDREPTSPMKPIRLDATQCVPAVSFECQFYSKVQACSTIDGSVAYAGVVSGDLPVKCSKKISVPLRHITKHDIRMLPTERRELPAINMEPTPPAPPAVAPRPSPLSNNSHSSDMMVAAQGGIALSPTSAVRGIFPTSKSRSLKKKSSILAKRRCVPYKMVMGRGAAGAVWQRVRARGGAAQPRWVRRQLLLTHNLLLAYRTTECNRAACMVYLAGYTAAAADEVKSRAHAFKVYHTGNAFYFACDSRDAMLAWIQLIHRATLLPELVAHVDVSRQFSETDYSETESDTESSERKSEKDRDKDKDKSKFGSLKKLTGRMQRSESQENVSHSSTSLDRKYLRFFSRHKNKDDTKPKNKQSIVPVPTEHYRSYRRVPSSEVPQSPDSPSDPPGLLGSELRASKKIPKPINYIHASNPNLLDFEKSDFVTKPALQPPPKPNVSKPESLAGLVTLEQFMLQKQEEERRQLYSNRVLRGIERDRRHDTIVSLVPDVIYGEVHPPEVPAPVQEPPALPAPPAPAPCYKERRPEPGKGKPISVKGKDGYEKIVYTDDPPDTSDGIESYVPPSYSTARERRPAPAPPAPERWRDSLRRNDKVHTAREPSATAGGSKPASTQASPHDTWRREGAAAGPGVSRLRLMFTHAQPPLPVVPSPVPQYPHLQCPPTFQPESYSLADHTRRRDQNHTDS